MAPSTIRGSRHASQRGSAAERSTRTFFVVAMRWHRGRHGEREALRPDAGGRAGSARALGLRRERVRARLAPQPGSRCSPHGRHRRVGEPTTGSCTFASLRHRCRRRSTRGSASCPAPSSSSTHRGRSRSGEEGAEGAAAAHAALGRRRRRGGGRCASARWSGSASARARRRSPVRSTSCERAVAPALRPVGDVRLHEAGGRLVEGAERRGVAGLGRLAELVERRHRQVAAGAGRVAGAEAGALVLREGRGGGVGLGGSPAPRAGR